MRHVIDFHSHILPGIDDGSKSVEESLEMLREMAKQGITHVVATPHFYPQSDTPERFLKRRAKAEAALRKAMAGYDELPELSIGAEVYYFRGMSDSEALSELTIDKKRCILIEMPSAPWTGAMYQELEDLSVKRGLLPVIAHLDRYIGPFCTHGIPKRLASIPVLVQANAEFFLQRGTIRMALRLLREEKIHLLGSDCHNLSSRAPNLGAALQKIEAKLGKHILGRVHAYEKFVFNTDEEI